MFLFINFFYCYRKSISIFDCYQIAILNILITDINYDFIDCLHLVLNFLYFNYFSQVCWQLTGINVTEEAELKLIFDPFSQTRLGNESNPFVVDARVAHVPVHDDIEDNQEFNGMWVLH